MRASPEWAIHMAPNSISFIQSLVDLCLFIHPKHGIKLLLYVDDITFAAKELSEIKWFLGMRVTCNRQTHKLFID
jgi:hypothetical protein